MPKAFKHQEDSLANSLKDTLHPQYLQDFDNLDSTAQTNTKTASHLALKTAPQSDCKQQANSSATQANDTVVLGLDYGVKKMGMATGNSVTQDAHPFDILAMNNGQPADWDNLIGIIVAWQFNEIIVGHPINMDGSNSMLAKRAHKFARRLAHRLIQLKLPVTVKLFDERLTSVEARKLAWELGLIKDECDPIDDISACLLLTSYLNNPEYAKEIATSNTVNHS